jgi:hypothetical protein
MPPTYKEYKSLTAEISGTDLAHYYNNEVVSLTSNGELVKLKLENSPLDSDQKQELINRAYGSSPGRPRQSSSNCE